MSENLANLKFKILKLYIMSRGDCIYSLDSVSEEEYSKIFDSYLTKKCKNQILDMLKSPDPTKHYGKSVKRRFLSFLDVSTIVSCMRGYEFV